MASNASRVSDAHKSKVANLNAANEPAAKKAQREKNKKVLQTAAQLNPEDHIKYFAGVKQHAMGLVDGIANEVVSGATTLQTILDATQVARDELEQVHQILAEANSLSALILAQEEQRANFEEEIAERKAAWEVEKSDREIARKRDDETYRYNLNVARRKENDEWEQEKQNRTRQFELVLAEREAVVAEGEKQVQASLQEIIDLREKVASAEARQEAEVKKQVAIATSALKKDLEHGFALERMKYENQANLDKQQILAQGNKIVSLEATVDRLQAKDAESTLRVQQIAERAVDAARPTFIPAYTNGHESGSTGKRAS